MKIKIVAYALLGIVLSAAPNAASAEVIYLACDEGGKITVDTEKNTVDNHPAQINATSIDWKYQVPGDPTGQVSYGIETGHIDRTTGKMNSVTEYHWASGKVNSGGSTYQCSATSAPATKF